MVAFVFPGQGAQFVGMGLPLYEKSAKAKELFDQAKEILGFDILEYMFHGSEADLKQTKVTQPAVFLHSVVLARLYPDFKPDMVAGHSLGEFSALVANGALSFEDGLKLVLARALAMQEACELKPSTMAAIIGLPDSTVEEVCQQTEGIVVPANYNSHGQIVISGELEAVNAACEALKAKGAKRALPLKVGGAFHSPLMEPARVKLAKSIEATPFHKPSCPIYQNVDAKPHTDQGQIKANLLLQLTHPVRWTQIVENMHADGCNSFIELGPGKVLQGLIGRTIRGADVKGFETL